MVRDSVQIHDWVVQGRRLLARGRAALEGAGDEALRALAGAIPRGMLDRDRPVTIVLAGQYSAGKSTILRALTGRDDIAVGAGITTQEARAYDWDGIDLVDTPGVHTQLRPDHDQIAYDAIARADLVVFVVTNELFDSHLAEHFRALAIEREKAHEMMLVVNKMERHALGNCEAARDAMRADLGRVLRPFTVEGLRTVFIDAKSARRSLENQGSPRAGTLYAKSGFAAFVTELNAFVRERHVSARYTTALYTLVQVLQEAIARQPAGDDGTRAAQQLLGRQRRALLETRNALEEDVRALAEAAAAAIRARGREAADLVGAPGERARLEREMVSLQEEACAIARDLPAAIDAAIREHIRSYEGRVEEIAGREPAGCPGDSLALDLHVETVTPASRRKIQHAARLAKTLGDALLNNSLRGPVSGGVGRLASASGSRLAKGGGHFFGHSFKSLEAVGFSHGMASVGKVLAVGGAVLTVFLQAREDANARRLAGELREARRAVRAGFNEMAAALEEDVENATRAFMRENMQRALDQVDGSLASLEEGHQARSAFFDALRAVRDEANALIRDMHQDTMPGEGAAQGEGRHARCREEAAL